MVLGFIVVRVVFGEVVGNYSLQNAYEEGEDLVFPFLGSGSGVRFCCHAVQLRWKSSQVVSLVILCAILAAGLPKAKLLLQSAARSRMRPIRLCDLCDDIGSILLEVHHWDVGVAMTDVCGGDV